MRGIVLLAAAGVMLSAAAGAQADAGYYCRAYARDAANARLSGAALLGAMVKPTAAEWDEANRLALADCLATYGQTEEPAVAARPKVKTASRPKLELLARKSAEATVASKPALVRGSEAWNDYCDKKYASFDRKTGTYTSMTGKVRPCVVSRN